MLAQGGPTAESSSYNGTAASYDAARDRQGYAESSGQAEFELALTAGHVLSLAASAGADWKVGSPLCLHKAFDNKLWVYVLRSCSSDLCSLSMHALFFTFYVWMAAL